MIWFLPLIVIGGIFIPWLGYLVIAMMAFLLTLAIFKGRYWCWNWCPRGAFLDGVLFKVSFNKPAPRSFSKQWFRWVIFILFMCFLSYRIINTGGNLIALGAVFVGMCLMTTVIAIVLGLVTRHRSWCTICPMGTLQEKISKISNILK